MTISDYAATSWHQIPHADKIQMARALQDDWSAKHGSIKSIRVGRVFFEDLRHQHRVARIEWRKTHQPVFITKDALRESENSLWYALKELVDEVGSPGPVDFRVIVKAKHILKKFPRQ